jgi:hypothetical protein
LGFYQSCKKKSYTALCAQYYNLTQAQLDAVTFAEIANRLAFMATCLGGLLVGLFLLNLLWQPLFRCGWLGLVPQLTSWCEGAILLWQPLFRWRQVLAAAAAALQPS